MRGRSKSKDSSLRRVHAGIISGTIWPIQLRSIALASWQFTEFRNDKRACESLWHPISRIRLAALQTDNSFENQSPRSVKDVTLVTVGSFCVTPASQVSCPVPQAKFPIAMRDGSIPKATEDTDSYDPTLDIRRSPLRPCVINLRWTLQGLHHYAILFRFRPQRT